MNKVYVVMKGYDYEGYTETDMKVFANHADAIAYADSLEADEFVDYVGVYEHEVN